jgi:rubrerythrin
MKRRKLNGKENDQLRNLKHENDRLKRENNRLKKQLARIDIETLMDLEDIEDHRERREASDRDIQRKEDMYRKKWSCHECKDGILRLFVYKRLDGFVYQRKCDLCGHKTKTQKYTPDVEGYIDPEKVEK